MKKELHLMIIWKNALFKKEEILDDLSLSFKIRNKFVVNWSDKNFSNNLSRFYGTSLPDNSQKELHCGHGKFLLIIFEDLNPRYDYRNTSHGKDYVNINVYDKKDYYREITGGKGSHMIHATNSRVEFNHDITLLLGVNEKDFVKKYKPSVGETRINNDIIGSDGWKNMEELFYVLNNTNDYVVLRDFENNLSEYPQKADSKNPSLDIDILSRNSVDALWTLNVINNNNTYYTTLKNKKVIYFDIKDIKEGYYCTKLGDDILNKKVYNGFYYIPTQEYHYYSCLYHALIHKFNFETEYNKRLEYIFGKKIHNSVKTKDYYIKKCSDWLIKNNYTIDVYTGNLEKFNIENIKKFDIRLNPSEVIYKWDAMYNYHKKIVELELENAQLRAEIIRLYNSRSWKITKPLRGIRHLTSRSQDKTNV